MVCDCIFSSNRLSTVGSQHPNRIGKLLCNRYILIRPLADRYSNRSSCDQGTKCSYNAHLAELKTINAALERHAELANVWLTANSNR
jgi:hypothetical protein